VTRQRTLSIAFDDWPACDRAGWLRAVAPANGLYDDAGGAAERFSERTLLKWRGSYGTWLSYLARGGELDPAVPAAARVTPARLDGWIAEQRARSLRDSTMHSRLRDLYDGLRLIQPGADVRFILWPRGIGLKRALPPTPRPFTVVEVRVLMAKALALFEAGLAGARYAGGAAAIRDAALIGLLAADAPRLGSIASMRLGQQLVRTATGYRIEFGAADTKTRSPLSYDLHPDLVPVFDAYLETARPRLGGERTDRLWCGTKGRALSAGGISKIVFRRTEEWFGEAHGPHWFRKCLRSSASRHSPEAAFDAATLLGHSPEISVRHYAEAGATAALRRHGKRITRLRAQSRLLAERFFAERGAGGSGVGLRPPPSTHRGSRS
jgi:hypothetical protein